MTSENDRTGEAENSLARMYFDQISINFRTVWDMYIKWYTVFLTVNILALAATVEKIDGVENWLIVAVAFSVQNALAMFTAIYIGYYSRHMEARIAKITLLLANARDPGADHFVARLGGPPIPGELGYWSGWANALGNASLIACWIAAVLVKTQ
jgi:hypothetical protein